MNRAGYRLSRAQVAWLAALLLVVGCSDEPRGGVDEHAGSGGAQHLPASGSGGHQGSAGSAGSAGVAVAPAGAGGRGGVGGVGGRESSAAGAGGSDVSAGAGGRGGSAAGGGGSAGGMSMPLEDVGPDDVDLTLGGFNQDIAEPSIDCLEDDLANYVCFAATVVINGQAREILCTSASIISQSGGAFDCRAPNSESARIDAGDFMVPGTFSVTESSVPGSILELTLMQGTFNPRAANFKEARIAGWANKWDDHGRLRNRVWGTVAATWNADGGTGETRVRGSFQARNFF
jgi:hypothetical protein